VGDAPCEEAPDSGILIQTPEGVGQITLNVNEAEVQLGSTVYLQTLADDEMAVNVVEHQATVSALGVTRFVPAGSRVRVPLDANLAANGPPSEPEPYDNADLAALPVGHMPLEVEVALALTQAELDALSANALPTSGDWEYTYGTQTLEGSCEGFSVSQPPQGAQLITLNGAFNVGFEDDWQTRLPIDFENPEFTNPEPGLFVAEWDLGPGALLRLEVRVLSPSQIEGAYLGIVGTDANCTVITPFTMVAVSEGVSPSAPGG
jgi:hypothetical protein